VILEPVGGSSDLVAGLACGDESQDGVRRVAGTRLVGDGVDERSTGAQVAGYPACAGRQRRSRSWSGRFGRVGRCRGQGALGALAWWRLPTQLAWRRPRGLAAVQQSRLGPPDGRRADMRVLSRILDPGEALRLRCRTGSQSPLSSTVSRTHHQQVSRLARTSLAYGCGPAPEFDRTSPAGSGTAEAVETKGTKSRPGSLLLDSVRQGRQGARGHKAVSETPGETLQRPSVAVPSRIRIGPGGLRVVKNRPLQPRPASVGEPSAPDHPPELRSGRVL